MVGLSSPRDEAMFRRHGSSLAMYRPIPDLNDFWEDHWGQRPISEVLAAASSGQLGELEYSFTKFLPPEGFVLEAGSGTGRIVQALTVRGFDIVGVDYAAETVRRVLEAAPSLRVEVGDLASLRWPDSTFDAYVSIGVMEHSFEGADPLILEAFRVLKVGGRALISVPYRNKLRTRRWRKVDDCVVETLPEGWRFYQDHLQVDDFISYIQGLGFKVVDFHPYGMFGALLRDSAILAALDKRGLLRHRLRKLIKRGCAVAPLGIRHRYSHMMMFVCEKPLSVHG